MSFLLVSKAKEIRGKGLIIQASQIAFSHTWTAFIAWLVLCMQSLGASHFSGEACSSTELSFHQSMSCWVLKWPTQGISVFPALKNKGPFKWWCLVCPWDQSGPARPLWEVEYKSCWACIPSSLCFNGSSRRAMSISQCRTSWFQACSFAYLPVRLHFLEISYDRGAPLCDTSQAAQFGPLVIALL